MWSNRLLKTAVCAAALASLGACAHDAGIGNHGALTPTERFSIQVTPHPQEVRLAPHRGGLSPNQAAALSQFAAEWQRAEGGLITLQSPQEAGDQEAVLRTTDDARRYLMSQGVAPENLRVVGYAAGDEGRAPIIVGYMAYTAQGPDCSRAWGNLTSTANNNVGNANFGCAVTANVAAQMANPGDLVQPRAEGPSDAARRGVVLGRYRNGEPTTSQTNTGASGTVSRAVN
jgi:pilus assembly protein CpaD